MPSGYLFRPLILDAIVRTSHNSLTMNAEPTHVPSLSRFAWLSIAAALSTIVLKAVAYLLTGSVGLLSDALESFINLVGALMALAMLTIAARPADEEHPYGHNKAEYFSSGVEGTLILLAAVSIFYAAIQRFLDPRPLEQVGIGLGVSIVASVINGVVARILLRASRQYHSITLEANSHHLMTDVWTSAGVVIGVGAVALTGWERLDPIVACLAAANIVWSGVGIVRNSVSGLMDAAIPAEDIEKLKTVLDPYIKRGVECHELRTRQSGTRQFLSLHVLVPGSWTVQRGHALLENLEADIRRELPRIVVLTHLESLNDPASWDDESGVRPGSPATTQSEKPQQK